MRVFPISKSVGTASVAGAMTEQVARWLNSVNSMFSSIVGGPLSKAISGSAAAGYTIAEVPMDKKRSHCRAAVIAASRVSSGRASPNHTISSRNMPPQGQYGILSGPSGKYVTALRTAIQTQVSV